MMRPRPAPRLIALALPKLHAGDGAIGVAMVGTAATLLATMIVRVAFAWWSGVL